MATMNSVGMNMPVFGFNDVPTMAGIFKSEHSEHHAPGQAAQSSHEKGGSVDAPLQKGTAGTDAQTRRDKGLDELENKGTAGTDAQSRKNKGVDEPLGKGTAGQDSQGRRN